MKIINLGSVNAGHLATILDVNNVQIGTCMDTPNNCAYALLINDKAVSVKTPYNGTYSRTDLKDRFKGLDENYHAKYVKYF